MDGMVRTFADKLNDTADTAGIIVYWERILRRKLVMGQKTDRKRYINAALFMLPAFILFTVLVIVPVLFSAYYSISDWKGIGRPVVKGLKNFITLFQSKTYWGIMWNTIRMLLASFLFQVPMGIVLAYLLYRKTKGFKIFRFFYFLPVVIAPIAIGIIFSVFFNADIGPFNKLLQAVGLGALQRNWLSDVKVVVNTVIFPQVWQYVGYTLVIVFAGMKAIDPQVLESAEIDGVNSFQMFLRIVIPMCWDSIVVAFVLIISGSLKSFDYSWAMTKGGPGNASSLLAVYMYKTAFVNNNFGQGSAISMTIMVFSAVFTYLFKKVANRD